MKIETISVSSFETNCYLAWAVDNRACAVIDPGDEDERIIERIDQLGLEPGAILLTHGHADHIGAVGPIKDKYGIPLYIGCGDESMLLSPSANISAYFGHQIICPAADEIVGDGDVFKIGSMSFTVIAAPGHSPGGICYFIDKYLFCGDTLFRGSIGRTDLPGGDYSQLIESIDRNILTLPDEVICFPGHGPATTVGEERKGNPFLTGRRFV
nr:MBL fold metallo-hydrolase [candidate division Zixibacteria bacterium]